MPQFYLLDHTLREVGGHHYDYALAALTAAEQAGFTPIAATHRHFQGFGPAQSHWRLLPRFRHGMWYRPGALHGPPLEPRERDDHAGLWQRCWARVRDGAKTLREADRERRRELSFSQACQRVFQEVPPQSGDVIFLPTVSEYDLSGVSRFLRDHRWTQRYTWHLQFHFNFLEGRDPEYAEQPDRLAEARRLFQQIHQRVPDHDLRFYTTTPQLSAQFSLASVRPFETLPYPVNPDLRSSPPQSTPDEPLRVTVAGGGRLEQGRESYGQIIDALWDDLLATGAIRLQIQATPELQAVLKQHLEERRRERGPIDPSAVLFLPHPLGATEYLELIRSSHIGLLMYDGRRYYTRRSGILGEFLSVGLPVVVPAACWLSEQIESPIVDHLLQLEQRCRAEHSATRLRWLPPEDARGGSPSGSPETRFRCTGSVSWWSDVTLGESAGDLPASHLLGTGQWCEAPPPGEFLEWEQIQYDRHGTALRVDVWQFGGENRERRFAALVPLAAGTVRVRCQWKNAFANHPLYVQDCRLSALALPRSHAPPAGAVGQVFASPDQLPQKLRELVAHYDHFRESAQQFSVDWNAAHEPRVLIDRLQSRTNSSPTCQRAAV